MAKKKDEITTTQEEMVERVAPNGQKYKVDKIEAFLEEYFKNGGSATQAAATLNQYPTLSAAAVDGTRMMNEAKKRGLLRMELEKRGYGLSKMMDVAIEKMENAKKPDWWDRLMKMAGYEDFMEKGSKTPATVSVNIFDAHQKMSSDYFEEAEVVEGEEEDGDSKQTD